MIRIDEEDLPTLSFGDSDVVRVGEWVLAVGNPGFGGGSALDYTVTAGIVSAKGRPLNLIQGELGRDPEFGPQIAQFAIEDFIQTDAVINPGNSGGPMVNLRAQVVGINSAIASQSGFYQGYGFAIPIDLARRVMEDLIEYGAVRRGYLGVRIAEVTPEDAEVYRLPDVSGVLIQDVPLDGPAADAGLQAEGRPSWSSTEITVLEAGPAPAADRAEAARRPGGGLVLPLRQGQGAHRPAHGVTDKRSSGTRARSSGAC